MRRNYLVLALAVGIGHVIGCSTSEVEPVQTPPVASEGTTPAPSLPSASQPDYIGKWVISRYVKRGREVVPPESGLGDWVMVELMPDGTAIIGGVKGRWSEIDHRRMSITYLGADLVWDFGVHGDEMKLGAYGDLQTYRRIK